MRKLDIKRKTDAFLERSISVRNVVSIRSGLVIREKHVVFNISAPMLEWQKLIGFLAFYVCEVQVTYLETDLYQ